MSFLIYSRDSITILMFEINIAAPSSFWLFVSQEKAVSTPAMATPSPDNPFDAIDAAAATVFPELVVI
jgi:hypothetical protein